MTSIRLRTAAFALLLTAPMITACTAEPTSPLEAKKTPVSADVNDTLSRSKPTQPWN